jgi:hypothetical protein
MRLICPINRHGYEKKLIYYGKLSLYIYLMQLSKLKCILLLLLILITPISMYNAFIWVSASSSSQTSGNDTQISTIVRQEIKKMFNDDHSDSNAPVNGEIRDPVFDWINMKNGQRVTTSSNVERSTDILSVDYNNNDKFLNSTLWLFFPVKGKPLKFEHIDYGMLIDADFDKSTGFDGIDYHEGL